MEALGLPEWSDWITGSSPMSSPVRSHRSTRICDTGSPNLDEQVGGFSYDARNLVDA